MIFRTSSKPIIFLIASSVGVCILLFIAIWQHPSILHPVESFKSFKSDLIGGPNRIHPFTTTESLKHIQSESYNSSLGNVGFISFLSTRSEDNEEDDDSDEYYKATRVLAYKLLHDPDTKSKQGIPFLVMVTSSVANWKVEQLIRDGAHVFEVDFIPIEHELMKGEKRWIDQYTKLRLWELTAFDRLLYIDSDMLIVKCLDGIFEDRASFPAYSHVIAKGVPPDEGPSPEEYLLAGVDDDFGPDNPIPRPESPLFNAGFFIFKPSMEIFQKYRRVMNFYQRYNSAQMEQGLLNYVHRLDGNMPWKRLEPGKWSVTWPNYNDYVYGVATLHDKLWSPTRDPRLRELWQQAYNNTMNYFNQAKDID